MSTEFRSSLEPFPLFIDSAPPNSANYFSSPIAMAAITLMATKPSSPSPNDRKPRLSIGVPPKLSNYIRLRYYQYEVTFGLYMLEPTEKIIFNALIFTMMIALLCALSWAFKGLFVNTVSGATNYLSGSVSSTSGVYNSE